MSLIWSHWSRRFQRLGIFVHELDPTHLLHFFSPEGDKCWWNWQTICKNASFFLENINISKLNMTKENKILVQMKLCIQKDTYLLHMHLRLNKISLTLLQCWRGREGQLLFLERFFISFFYNKKFALAKNSVFGHFRSYKLVNSI